MASPDPPLPTVAAVPRVRAGSERGRPHLLPAGMLTFLPRMDPGEERLRLKERRPAASAGQPGGGSAGCASGSGPRRLQARGGQGLRVPRSPGGSRPRGSRGREAAYSFALWPPCPGRTPGRGGRCCIQSRRVCGPLQTSTGQVQLKVESVRMEKNTLL